MRKTLRKNQPRPRVELARELYDLRRSLVASGAAVDAIWRTADAVRARGGETLADELDGIAETLAVLS